MFNLASTLDFQIGRITSLEPQKRLLESQLEAVNQQKVVIECNIRLIELSIETYKKAVDLVYESSIGELEKVVNVALSFVFFDRNYRFSVNLDDKYGKSMSFTIVDNTQNPPIEVDVKDGVGCGLRTVVSFVIHFYYLLNKNKLPILFVDEGYAAISAQYRDRFFMFVKELCREKNGALVLITHDPELASFADQAYTVNDGKVVEQAVEKP